MDKKQKDKKLKDEPCHKAFITELHQKVHILEVPLKITKVTMTLDLATKVYTMAIQPCNGDNNAALQRIVSAIALSIVHAGVLSGT